MYCFESFSVTLTWCFSGHSESEQKQTHCVWFWGWRWGWIHKQTRTTTNKLEKKPLWARFRIWWRSTNIHVERKGKYGPRLDIFLNSLICSSCFLHNSTEKQQARWQQAVWQWRWGRWFWGRSFPDQAPVWGQSWTEGLDWESLSGWRDSEFVWFLIHLSSSLFQLMKLQAKFGTDSRFQVDSRFLESDDEPEDQGNLFNHVLGFECVWKNYSPVFNLSNFRWSGSRKRCRQTTSWGEKEKSRHPPEHFKHQHTTTKHQKGQDVQVWLLQMFFKHVLFFSLVFFKDLCTLFGFAEMFRACITTRHKKNTLLLRLRQRNRRKKGITWTNFWILDSLWLY